MIWPTSKVSAIRMHFNNHRFRNRFNPNAVSKVSVICMFTSIPETIWSMGAWTRTAFARKDIQRRLSAHTPHFRRRVFPSTVAERWQIYLSFPTTVNFSWIGAAVTQTLSTLDKCSRSFISTSIFLKDRRRSLWH